MDKIVVFVVNLIIMITFLNKEWCRNEVSAAYHCSFVENYYADGSATNMPGTLKECQDRCISFSWCLGYNYFNPNCRLLRNIDRTIYRWPNPIYEKSCEDVCAPGEEYKDNNCIKCNIGFYKDQYANTSCTKCPDHKITLEQGSSSITNCNITHCEIGFYSPDNIFCFECPFGTYKNFTGNQQCLHCPSYRTTTENGSIDISNCSFAHCEPGFSSRDSISCSVCPNGTFKNFTGNQPCSKCPMNTTTREVGSTDISNCSLDCSTICTDNDPCKYTGTSSCVCPSGYYGSQCSKRCSPGCLNDSCNKLDGTCPCKEGYFDDKCLKSGGFAHNNQWIRHCKANCSEERNFKFDLCYMGWFGDSCLYKDLGVLAIMDNKVLNDNNHSTCVKRNSVTIDWQQEIQAVTWVRLVFMNNGDVREIIAFYFNNNDMNTSLVCNSVDMRYRKVGNTSMDFYCDGSYFVTTVQVSWQSESLLCSVHVNGGRNIAPTVSKVRWSLSEYKRTNIETLTDGYYGRDGCLTMNSSITLQLYFLHEVYSAQVLLYTDFSRDDGRGNFFVELIDANGQVQSKMFSSGKDVFVQTAFFNSVFQFQSVNITVLSGTLDLCEVEVYGDCIAPYYGYSCLDICYLACLDQDCTYGGECYECTPGRTGTYCEDSLYNTSDFVTVAEAARQSSTEASFSVAKIKSVINKYVMTLIVCVLTLLIILIGKTCFSFKMVREEEE